MIRVKKLAPSHRPSGGPPAPQPLARARIERASAPPRSMAERWQALPLCVRLLIAGVIGPPSILLFALAVPFVFFAWWSLDMIESLAKLYDKREREDG